jgi:repressor LexA
VIKKLNENILSFVETFIKTHGYSPSIRDIKTGLRISSTCVVSYHLVKLKKLGLINYTPNIARSIVIVKTI